MVHELEPKLIITTMHGQQHIKKKNHQECNMSGLCQHKEGMRVEV